MLWYVVAAIVALPAGLLVVVWAGSRLLSAGGPTSSSNAFGGFNVFNPGQERTELELESKKRQVVVMPSAGDDNNPLRIDLTANSATVRKPAVPPAGQPEPPPEPDVTAS